jgi:hypothetical protein
LKKARLEDKSPPVAYKLNSIKIGSDAQLSEKKDDVVRKKSSRMS